MKAASAGLIALLATRKFFSADLYQFSLYNGPAAETTLYYTSGDRSINWNGQNWLAPPAGPAFDRKDNKAKCHWKVGIEVDTLVFDCIPGPALIGGEPFLSAVRQGVFDGAEMTLYRAFMPTYGNTSNGTVVMFAGRIAEIDASRSLATFSVNSHLELFNQQMPRNLYQASCVNTLFDASCGLSASAYAVSGTVAAGSTQSVMNATLSQASGYFNLGKVVFTSGANLGFARTVQAYTKGSPGTVSFISPFPSAPAAGDAFTIYPGCDHLETTCCNKYSNLVNFRGFPYIPQPATAV